MTELWYRLNILGEKNFFERKDLIDGLIVPAHLVAYYEIAIPEFLSNLGLPLLIDPMTYVWGIDPQHISKEGDLKKSYKKLVEKLDCKIANILGEQGIQKIKEDSLEFQEFIDKVLKFQLLGDVKKTPRRTSMERLKHYGEKTKPEEPVRIRPYALIPPYFYFSTVLGPAYQKTVYSATFAKDSDYGKQHKICPCLCMDKILLADEGQLNKVIEDFKDFSEVILWINDLDETEARLHELTGFVDLISKFREAKIDVINLYGGYFSLILNHIGLSKLSCGICYSHRKGVFAEVGGGGLPTRYYEPHLKKKLLADDMIRLYSDTPELFTCNCPICSSHSEKYRTVQTTADKESILTSFFGELGEGIKMKKEGIIDWKKSRWHFLYVRKMEQKYTNENKLEDIVSDLMEKYNLRIDAGRLGLRVPSLEYLKLWADSLEGK